MGLQNSGTGKRTASSESNDSIDLAAIDAALSSLACICEPKPEGFTTEEYADKRGVTMRTAQRHLAALYKADLADRVIWSDEGGQKKYVYRLKS